MKKTLVLISFLLSGVAFGQQQQQFSQYLHNPYVINPAFAGVHDGLDIIGSFRQQWMNFTNAPRTYYLTATYKIGGNQGPLYNPSLRTGGRGPAKIPEIQTGSIKHGVGFTALADTYGAFQRNQVMGSYAIHVPISRGYNLAVGVSGGISNNIYNQDKVDLLVDNDPTHDAFVAAGTSQNYVDANAGIYFYSDKLFVGYSSAQLLKTAISFGSGVTNFDLHMHHFITAGYRLDLDKDWSIVPSAMVKYMSPAPVSYDISVKGIYQDWMWSSITYRHGDALVGMIGMYLNNIFKFGYSYDFTLSGLRPYNSGGHEIVLGATFGIE